MGRPSRPRRIVRLARAQGLSGVGRHGWVLAGTIGKMLYGIATLRVAAQAYGIESLTTIGQLLSLTSLLSIGSLVGAGRGITQRHAQSEAKSIETTNLAALQLGVLASLTLAVVMLGLLPFGADRVIGPGSPPWVLPVLAAAVPLMAFNSLCLSIAPAHGLSAKASQAVLLGAVGGFAMVLVVGSRSLGALLIVVAALPVANAAAIALRLGPDLPAWGVDRSVIKSLVATDRTRVWTELRYLLAFSAATLLPVAFQQIARIASRTWVRSTLGSASAGLWEAVTKLQEGYVQLLGAILVFNLFPQLVQRSERASRLVKLYVAGEGLILCGGLVVALLAGGRVLSLVYGGDAAAGGASLLVLVLLGDCARLYYTVNQFRFLAQRSLRTFVLLELVNAVTLTAAAVLGSRWGSLNAVFAGYVAQGMLISASSALASNRWVKSP